MTGERCRNCGAIAGPAYCGSCGQELRERRGPFLGVLRDALSEFVAVDGALWRTLRSLAVPGRLTCEFLAGRRASYLRPVRLYAVASLALFSSVLSLQTPEASQVNLYINGELVTPAPALRGAPDYTIDTQGSPLFRWLLGESLNDLDHLRGRPAQEIFDAVFAGLRRILPVALIVFVPFLALAMRLVYVRSTVLYVDHVVFCIHAQSAIFIAMAVGWAATRLAGLGAMFTLLVYMGIGATGLTVYLPLALRRVYRQSWIVTLLKAAALGMLYLMLMQLVLGISISAALLQA